MLHLSPERLAALADDSPTPGEAEHLERCAECARERAAHGALLTMAAAERDAIAAPISDWNAIATSLATSDRSAAPALRRASAWRGRGWSIGARAAAAVVLLASGVVLGRRSAGAPLDPRASRAPAAESLPVASATDPGTPATPASSSAVSNEALVPEFRTVDEARAALTRYEVAYQNAAAYLAVHDSSTRVTESSAYRTRLAALDRVGRAMREAMREAPYDPVINGYYLTTIGQREATMRQLNTALPTGVRLTSF